MPGYPGMSGMPGMHEPDEEMAELMRSDHELEQRSMQLAHRYRMSRDEARDDLKKELEEVVNKHFDVRQQRRELQIKRMEESLEKLRGTIKKRADAREEIVDKRLRELMGERSELEF